MLEAAERAAGTGDYAMAERHLRAAIEVQEATLGAGHPDLASTLNNLGIVCERAGNTAAAEHSYRRAYAVARAAFDAEHPSVVTSARNLREFCEAFGRPFEPPTPAPAVHSRVEPPASTPVPAPERPSPAEPRRPSFRISVRALATLGAAGLALVWLTAGGGSRAARDVPRSAAEPTPAAAEKQPAAPTAPEAGDVKSSHPATSSRPWNPASRAEHGRAAAAATSISVARAQVCRGLTTRASNAPDWPCEPVGGSISSGTLFFYTRLASPRQTAVLHRWYRGDSLQQEVELDVSANPGSGYRTYSRLTIGPERSGDWRVELRTTDGVLLHKESFVVR